ncbi:MAG: O-sialoglycoprotein endopeptidase [Clostridiales bacterium]|nr:O-sialoglycoprotein endopeptidase [Clostridiales bacterium]
MAAVLGLDTSCYTTSAALASGGQPLAQQRLLLTVPEGGRGLRQSQAVFQHVGRLPALTEELMRSVSGIRVAAVCASTRPRPIEGSYMPVFTVGEGFGRAIAATLGAPFYATTHQQGHLRAALVGGEPPSGRYVALHLSGGTTEALLADGDSIELLGGTSDLHAGQFVDRVGVALGLPFPAGPHLEQLAAKGKARGAIPASIDGLTVSFSGAESQAQRLIASGALSPEDAAAEVFSCLARTIGRLVAAAARRTGAAQALLFGGVASSALLRALLAERLQKDGCRVRLIFGRPELSGDNAVGVALLGEEAHRAGE